MKKNYIIRIARYRILCILCLLFSFTVFAQAQDLSITCVPGFTITCETDVILDVDAPFVFSPNCNVSPGAVTVSGPALAGPLGCPGSTYTYTYTVVDDCGASASCEQTFTVGNQVGPSIISCPPNQTASCSFNVFPQPHLVEVQTPCGLATDIEVLGPQVFGPAECTGTQYIYTYVARDLCGRTAQCQQVYTLSNEGSEFVCPPDICVLECPADGDMIAAQFASFATQATIINPCGNESTVTNNFSPNNFINANCGSGPIAYENATEYQIVTFTAVDDCFGFTNCTALVVVVDNEPPVVTGAPQLGIAECGDRAQTDYNTWIQQTLDNMSAEDACSNVIWSYAPQTPTEICGINGYAITHVSFSATDDCGNSTTLEAHFKLKNNFPPTFVDLIPEIEVNCGVPANFIEPAVQDACGNTTVTFVDSTLPGDCSGTPIQVRTYTVTDDCGQSSTGSQSIVVIDNEAPVFTNTPAPVVVDCGAPIVFVEPTAIDACGGPVTITFNEYTVGNADCANGQQTNRDWTATDGCGNQSTVTTIVTQAGDDTPPTFTNVPGPVSFTCGETISFEAPTATDACSGPVTITFEEYTVGNDCTNGQQINRDWTATDACGNQSTVTTSVTLEGDTEAPVFTFVPETPDVNCGNIPEFEEPIATDDCGNVTITFVEYQSPGTICDDGYSLKRDWTAVDNCGNATTVTTAIWVNADVAPPVFTFVPETPDVNCGNIPAFEEPTATDDCGSVTITFVEYQSPGTICDDGYSLKRDWTATDDCGNATTVTTAIWVNPDITPPVFTFVPETPDVGCNNIPEFEIPTAVDDCGNVTITFVEYQSPPNGVECVDGIARKRDWTATDDCGNASTVTTTIWINEYETNTTTATVSGMIMNAADEVIDEVYVMAEGSSTTGMMGDMTTDETGEYNFDLDLGQNYTITPARDGDVLNGISTMDLILLGQHLLEIQPLDSPYKVIAADINNSGSVSSLDMIALRRLILHIDEDLTNNTSWRFVDADYVFSNPTNPFATTFPEVVNINGLNGTTQQDFVGIKVGDLNGSAIPNALLSGDTRTERSTQHFLATDARIEKGASKRIEIKATDFTTILGYQMTLEFDPTKMEILEIIPEALRELTDDNFGMQNQAEGIITTSWNTINGLSLEDETVLFSIVVKAKETITMSETLRSSSKVTNAEAYSEIEGIMHSNLLFDQNKGFEKDRFSLYQNYPNPFEVNTKIGFYLDKAGEATLTVYDMDGKVRFIKNGSYENGYHEITLGAEQLGDPGMLYYQLNATDRKPQIKKMVWIRL